VVWKSILSYQATICTLDFLPTLIYFSQNAINMTLLLNMFDLRVTLANLSTIWLENYEMNIFLVHRRIKLFKNPFFVCSYIFLIISLNFYKTNEHVTFTFTPLIQINCCLKNLRGTFMWKCIICTHIFYKRISWAVVRWKVFFGRLPLSVWFRSANSHINIIF